MDHENCKIENVTSMANVVKFLNSLRESGAGPSGQITKLTKLQDSMKMLISRVPDDETKELVIKAKVVYTAYIIITTLHYHF